MKARALLLAWCALLLCAGCEEAGGFDARAESDRLQGVIDKLYAQGPQSGDADTSELEELLESYTPAQFLAIARVGDLSWYGRVEWFPSTASGWAFYRFEICARERDTRAEAFAAATNVALSDDCPPLLLTMLAGVVFGGTSPKGLADAGVSLDEQMEWMRKLLALFDEEDTRTLRDVVHHAPHTWAYIRNRPASGEAPPDIQQRLDEMEGELIDRLTSVAADTEVPGVIRGRAIRPLCEDWLPQAYRERILDALTKIAEEPTETLIPDLARDVAGAFRKLGAEDRITPYLSTLSRQEPGRH